MTIQEQAIKNLRYKPYGITDPNLFCRDDYVIRVTRYRDDTIVNLFDSSYVVLRDGIARPYVTPGFESSKTAEKYPLAREIADEYNRIKDGVE